MGGLPQHPEICGVGPLKPVAEILPVPALNLSLPDQFWSTEVLLRVSVLPPKARFGKAVRLLTEGL